MAILAGARLLKTGGRNFFRARKARRLREAKRQRDMLNASAAARAGRGRALLGVGAGAGTIGGGAWLTRKIGQAFTGFLDPSRDESDKIRQDGVDLTSAIAEKEAERPRFERIDVTELFEKVEVDPVQITPKLGPDDDEYHRHLNLVIERVAQLESKVATQNSLIAKLQTGTNKAIEQNRKADLRERRQRTEDDIEKGFVRKKFDESLSSVKKTTEDTYDSAKSIVARVAKIGGTIGGLFTLSALASTAAAAEEEDFKRSAINIFQDWTNIEEDEFDEETENVEFKDIAEEISRSIATDVTAAKGALIGTRWATRSKSVSPGTETVARTTTTATGATPPATTPPVQKAGMFRRGLNKFIAAARVFKSKAKEIARAFANWSGSLGRVSGRIFRAASRNFGRIILSLYVLFEVIDALRRNVQMFGSGEISEEEFHEGNKNQINRILGELGLPLLMAIIGGKIGASAGFAASVAVLGLGAVPGGILGFVVGLIFGIGAEYVYRALNLRRFVDAIYESIFMEDDGPLFGMVDRIQTWVDRIRSGAETARERVSTAWVVTGGRFFGGGVGRPTPVSTTFSNVQEAEPQETTIQFSDEELRNTNPELYNEYIAFKREREAYHFEERESRNRSNNPRLTQANRNIARLESTRDARAKFKDEIAATFIDDVEVETNVSSAVESEVFEPNQNGAEELTSTFSEDKLRNADPELYEQYITFKREREAYHFETRESRNRSNNTRLTQANRNIAITKATRDAIEQFQKEINTALSEEVTTNQIPESESGTRKTVIVPIVQPQQQYSHIPTQSAGQGMKSELESASPTYATYDSFYDMGQMT